MVAKSCKIQKPLYFTYCDPKNTHIIGYKIVYKCTSVIVTVHIYIYIYMVIVALGFNIFCIFGSVRFVRERGSERENNKKL